MLRARTRRQTELLRRESAIVALSAASSAGRVSPPWRPPDTHVPAEPERNLDFRFQSHLPPLPASARPRSRSTKRDRGRRLARAATVLPRQSEWFASRCQLVLCAQLIGGPPPSMNGGGGGDK